RDARQYRRPHLHGISAECRVTGRQKGGAAPTAPAGCTGRRIGAMPTYRFRVNGRPVTVDAWDPTEPLLYALRGPLALHGTKFGCGLGQCGACTVLVDKTATRSCQLPVHRPAG